MHFHWSSGEIRLGKRLSGRIRSLLFISCSTGNRRRLSAWLISTFLLAFLAEGLEKKNPSCIWSSIFLLRGNLHNIKATTLIISKYTVRWRWCSHVAGQRRHTGPTQTPFRERSILQDQHSTHSATPVNPAPQFCVLPL